MSKVKEPSYFSFADGEIPNLGPDVDQHYIKLITTSAISYRKLFETDRPYQHYGEASPSYLYIAESAERISRQLPDVKIICLFRNPVERAFSQFMHMVRDGLEEAKDFEQALEMEQQRREQGGWWGRHYERAGFYADQWARYVNLFDRHQCLTLLYDDVETAPEQVYRRLCGFLGMSSEHQPDFAARVNDTRSLNSVPRSAALSRLLWQPNRTRQSAAKLLPASVRDSLKSLAKRLNQSPIPELRDETRQKLWEKYRHDVSRLEELIGRDLSLWTPEQQSLKQASKDKAAFEIPVADAERLAG